MPFVQWWHTFTEWLDNSSVPLWIVLFVVLVFIGYGAWSIYRVRKRFSDFR